MERQYFLQCNIWNITEIMLLGNAMLMVMDKREILSQQINLPIYSMKITIGIAIGNNKDGRA